MEATTAVMGLTGNSNFTSDLTHISKTTGQKMLMTPSSITYKINTAEKVVIKWSNCVDFYGKACFSVTFTPNLPKCWRLPVFNVVILILMSAAKFSP